MVKRFSFKERRRTSTRLLESINLFLEEKMSSLRLNQRWLNSWTMLEESVAEPVAEHQTDKEMSLFDGLRLHIREACCGNN